MSNDSITDVAGVRSSRGRKRKSRWSDAARDGTSIPGMPTVLPNTFTPQQQEMYVLQLQIEEINRQLRSGEVTIPEERSPSPAPIYDLQGKRLNTRTNRVLEKLKEQRHRLIQQLQLKHPDYKPPSDYKPTEHVHSEKVFIPREEYSNINFIGLIIGPRGNTLKTIEKDTGARIIIRGNGSGSSSKVKPVVAADEPLHALVTATTSEAVTKAVNSIQEIIKQGINEPHFSNQLRRQQLLELAQINGTVRQPYARKSWSSNTVNCVVCLACGGGGHITSDCRSSKHPQNQDKKLSAADNALSRYDQSYMDFLTQIGEIQSGRKNGSSDIQARTNESSDDRTALAQGGSTVNILPQSSSLTQQTVSSLYPSPKPSTFQFVDLARPPTRMANLTDPPVSYYPQTTSSITSSISGTTNELPDSSQYVLLPPSETSTNAFMNQTHEPCQYWVPPPPISEYGIESAHYLNLGDWNTENASLYGYFPEYTLPKP